MALASITDCGGKVGDACTKEGDLGECGSDAICTKIDLDVLQCLKVCTEQIDCTDDQACNGATGSSVEVCRPKDASSGSGGSGGSGGSDGSGGTPN
jgi:hypothetical protein